MSAGDPNTDTHTCSVNITPTVPSLQPQYALLKLNNALSVYHFETFFIQHYFTLQRHSITIVKFFVSRSNFPVKEYISISAYRFLTLPNFSILYGSEHL